MRQRWLRPPDGAVRVSEARRRVPDDGRARWGDADGVATGAGDAGGVA